MRAAGRESQRSSRVAAEAIQEEHRLACLEGRSDIDLELRHPIIIHFRIDEHLLNTPGPGFLVYGDIRVPQVTRLRVKAKTGMPGSVSVPRCRESFRCPQFALPVAKVVEYIEGGGSLACRPCPQE